MSDERKPFNNTIETAVGFAQFQGQLQRIEDMVAAVKEKQDEMSIDISKIKEAIYNPDQGIYTRLKDVEAKVKDHEKIVKLEQEVKELKDWKAGIVKVGWIAGASIIGSIALALWNLIKGA